MSPKIRVCQIGVCFACHLELLCHVGNVDIPLNNVRDHAVNGLFVLFFLKIRTKRGSLSVPAGKGGWRAVMDFGENLGHGSSGITCFSTGSQP